MRAHWLRPMVLIVASTLVATACGVSGLSFAQDERVKIVSPTDNDEVKLPFELRWSARDFDGSFVVLFDRSPMRPDETVRSLVPENDPCRGTSGCPDAQWLADHDVYVTDGTSVRIERLPDERHNNHAKDRHDVTIVLLDEDGQRSGESAFTREFIVDRGD